MSRQIVRIALSIAVLAMAVALCGCPSTQTSSGHSHGTKPELAPAEWEELVVRWTDWIAREPLNPNAYAARGKAHDNLKRHDKAIADYTKAIELRAKSHRRGPKGDREVADDYLKRARTYQSLGRYEEAIADYTSALRYVPSYDFLYDTRATLQLKIGRRKDAIASYLEACDTVEYLTPEKRKHAEHAIEECNKLLAQEPDSETALTSRARAWVHLKETHKAIADYSELIKRRPNHVPTYLQRAELHRTLKGAGNKAIADYSRVIELQPDHAIAYCTRAELHIALKQYDAALRDAEKAIQLNPNYAKAYFHRGEVHESRKNYAQAVRDMRIACELPYISEQIGYAYRIKKIANLVLAKDPNNAPMLRARAFANIKSGRPDLALADCAKVLQIDPKDADAYFVRGLAYNRLWGRGDPDSPLEYAHLALADFQRVAELRPKSAKAWYDLGIAHYNMSLFDKARVDFKRAVMYDTAGAYTKKAQAALAKLRKEGR